MSFPQLQKKIESLGFFLAKESLGFGVFF